MTFVTAGLAIAGAASILIPILIHLLWRRRRRPIEWAAMRFLLEAFRKQRRRLRLEQFLLLLVRCLIVFLLGAALARPLLESTGVIAGEAGRSVILVIDNGLASRVQEESGRTALERHLETALEIVGALGPAEAAGIITAARPAQSPVIPPSLDHTAVAGVLETIAASESPTDLPAALRRAREAAETVRKDGRRPVIFLLSDFRAGSARLEAPLPRLFESDSNAALFAAPPATRNALNVQVIDIEPVRRLILPGASDGSQQITVHLGRHGADLHASQSRVRITGEGIGVVAPKMVEWAPGQSAASVTFTIALVSLAGETIGLTATVDDIDALPLDNSRYITLDVRERLRVCMVSPPTFERIGVVESLTPGQWIRRALHPGESGPMDVVDVPPGSLDMVDLRGSDVAIVTRPDRLNDDGWDALRTFVDQGGLVIVTPPADLNVHPWTESMVERLSLPWRIALEAQNHDPPLLMANEQPPSELLRLLLPEVADLTRSVVIERSLPLDRTQTQANEILLLENGSPLLIAGTPRADEEESLGAERSRGLVVYLSVAPTLSPEWTNLPTQVFMVPLFQEMVRQGVNLIRASQEVLVGDRPPLIGLNATAVALRSPDSARISFDRLRQPATPLHESGLYAAVDARGESVDSIAVNLDPIAGYTETQREASILSWLEGSGRWRLYDPQRPASVLASAEGRAALAGILLLVVLALLVIETILARRFSHAYRTMSGAELTGGLRPTVAEVRT